MEDLKEFLSTLSNPVLAMCAVYIAKSIHDLNLKVAVICEQIISHEKRISKLEE